MKPLIRFFANSVANRPGLVLSAVLIATLGLGFMATQVENSDGQEGFSPDNPEILAAEQIGELFGEEATQSVMQIVVESESGDVLTTDGLAAANGVFGTIQGGFADVVVDSPQQPGVVTFLAPVQQAAAQQGIDMAVLDDASVKQIYAQALEQGGEQLGFVTQLVNSDASTGLILP